MIDRFSEDVDITLDFSKFSVKGFEEAPNYKNHQLSRNKIKRYGELLRDAVVQYVAGIVIPHLTECVKQLPSQVAENVTIKADRNNAENVFIFFPFATNETNSDYIKDRVLIEFGGRNVINPNASYKITPYIADVTRDLDLPCAAGVTVITAERTFWEKVTLIHVACNKPGSPSRRERQSRHWYDVYRLYKHGIGKTAITDKELLQDVVDLKKFFYHYGYADYDNCLTGGCKLVPSSGLLTILEEDYTDMINAGFMYGEKLSFSDLMAVIQEIETEINT